jgi:hypothetical protein
MASSTTCGDQELARSKDLIRASMATETAEEDLADA